MTRRPTLSGIDRIRPQPVCGASLTIQGFRFRCDEPKGHLPAETHAQRITWTAPVVPEVRR